MQIYSKLINLFLSIRWRSFVKTGFYFVLLMILGNLIFANSLGLVFGQDQIQDVKTTPEDIPWWLLLIIGGFISAIIQNVFSSILPSKIREKLRYGKKWLAKIFKQTKIKVQVIAKTLDLSNRNLGLEATHENLKQIFVDKNYTVTSNENSLVIRLPYNNKEIESRLIISTTILEGNEIVDQIQWEIQQECSFVKFKEDVYEMREIQTKINSVISDDY